MSKRYNINGVCMPCKQCLSGSHVYTAGSVPTPPPAPATVQPTLLLIQVNYPSTHGKPSYLLIYLLHSPPSFAPEFNTSPTHGHILPPAPFYPTFNLSFSISCPALAQDASWITQDILSIRVSIYFHLHNAVIYNLHDKIKCLIFK